MLLDISVPVDGDSVEFVDGDAVECWVTPVVDAGVDGVEVVGGVGGVEGVEGVEVVEGVEWQVSL